MHHDEVMNAELLPTFNSFGIISQLHRIPGLSQNFVYLEDDMLFLTPTTVDDFVSPDGLTWMFEEKHIAPRLDQIADPQRTSGWNMALASSNRLQDHSFGVAVRHHVHHVLLLIGKAWWDQKLKRFP